jgi:hypothetical protein
MEYSSRLDACVDISVNRQLVADATASTIALTARLIAMNVKTRRLPHPTWCYFAYDPEFRALTSLALPSNGSDRPLCQNPNELRSHLGVSQSTLMDWTWPVAT